MPVPCFANKNQRQQGVPRHPPPLPATPPKDPLKPPSSTPSLSASPGPPQAPSRHRLPHLPMVPMGPQWSPSGPQGHPRCPTPRQRILHFPHMVPQTTQRAPNSKRPSGPPPKVPLMIPNAPKGPPKGFTGGPKAPFGSAPPHRHFDTTTSRYHNTTKKDRRNARSE
jgi:hypothetical protein